MPFEIFRITPPGHVRNPEPVISIYPNGQAWLNMAATKHLGEATHVQLLHDPDRHLFALKACDKNTHDAYRLTTARSNRAISITAFLKANRAAVTRGVKLPTFIEDGLLCADFSHLLHNPTQ